MARSISDAWQHASVLIPLRFPLRRTPREVSADPMSPWHVSALLSTAIETATLAARLLPSSSSGPQPTLDSMASSLNIQGNHTISTLQMSIGDNRATRSHSAKNSLDMELSSVIETQESARVNSENHVYAQTLAQRSVSRGNEEQDLVYHSLFSNDEEAPMPPPTNRFVHRLSDRQYILCATY